MHHPRVNIVSRGMNVAILGIDLYRIHNLRFQRSSISNRTGNITIWSNMGPVSPERGDPSTPISFGISWIISWGTLVFFLFMIKWALSHTSLFGSLIFVISYKVISSMRINFNISLLKLLNDHLPLSQINFIILHIL